MESWAYCMGHFLSDRTYGTNADNLVEQGIFYQNNNPVAGLSSHLNLLEDFSPFRNNDPFRWIPEGLFYDLRDNRNDQLAIPQRVLINDEVSAYSNKQMFSAFQSNINTLQDYRLRLIQQNPGNPTTNQATNLFMQYGY